MNQIRMDRWTCFRKLTESSQQILGTFSNVSMLNILFLHNANSSGDASNTTHPPPYRSWFKCVAMLSTMGIKANQYFHEHTITKVQVSV